MFVYMSLEEESPCQGVSLWEWKQAFVRLPGCQELPAPLFSDKIVTVGARFKPQEGWVTFTVRLFGHDARDMAQVLDVELRLS